MNLNGILSDRDTQARMLVLLKFVIAQALNLAGLLVFWLFMVALIATPLWVPILVNRLLTH